MRFQIHKFRQSVLCELGIDTEEALLLDWFLNFKDGGKMDRIVVGNDLAFWVDFGKVVEDLPILFIKSKKDKFKTEEAILRNCKDKVGRMLKGNLSKILIKHNKKVQGKTKVYLSINRELLDRLVNEDKEKAPTQKADAKHKKTNNNNICTYEQYYTQDSEKSEVENFGNEIINLLEENKITGINKSDAIKTFTDIDKLMFCLKKITIKTYAYLKATYTTKSTYMSSKKKNTFDNFDNTISDYTDDIFERANRAKWENKDKEARRKYTQKSEFV